MKILLVFNAVTNIIILCVLIKMLLKKHFHISIDRHIFTRKIESISLMRNTAWFDDGEFCSAMGVFTIPLRGTS